MYINVDLSSGPVGPILTAVLRFQTFIRVPDRLGWGLWLGYLDVPLEVNGSMVIGSMGYFTDPYKWGI